MHKTLVLWADDRSANLGVRVLAYGAQAFVERRYPGSEVTFQDFAPSVDGFSPVSRRSLVDQVARRSVSRWFSQFDLVLDTGAGDSFSDIYGIKRLAQISMVTRAADAAGVETVLLPQTIGPFGSSLSRALARFRLRAAADVMVRDPQSAKALDRLGFPDYEVASDLVFLLPAPNSNPPKIIDVLLNVSGLLWTSSTLGDSNQYQSDIRRLIERLESNGRVVTLLPHVLENATEDNDLIAISALLDWRPSLDVVIPTSLESVRETIASASLVIGSRMHACLNALSMGVPAIPWAYSRKFGPLLEAVGWSHVVDLRFAHDPVADTLRMMQLDDQLVSHASAAASRGRELIEGATYNVRN